MAEDAHLLLSLAQGALFLALGIIGWFLQQRNAQVSEDLRALEVTRGLAEARLAEAERAIAVLRTELNVAEQEIDRLREK